MPSQEPTIYMHIGEVATRTELSLRSLRHWDDVGLLQPSGRTDGGFRLYTEADVEKILVIRRMKPLGFSIEEMRVVMGDLATLSAPIPDPSELEAAHRRLDAIAQDAAARREKLVRQVEMADEFIDLIGKHSSARA
ncbi:MerR family transcriptional regulator [soil metagenome]